MSVNYRMFYLIWEISVGCLVRILNVNKECFMGFFWRIFEVRIEE